MPNADLHSRNDAWSKRQQQLTRYERRRSGRKADDDAVLPPDENGRAPPARGSPRTTAAERPGRRNRFESDGVPYGQYNYDLDIAVPPLGHKSPKLKGTVSAQGERSASGARLSHQARWGGTERGGSSRPSSAQHGARPSILNASTKPTPP